MYIPRICTLLVLWGIVASAPAATDLQSVQDRVNKLVEQMTVDEKIGQLSQLFMFGPPEQFEGAVEKGQLGLPLSSNR